MSKKIQNHVHVLNVLTITNELDSLEREVIKVSLECLCDDDIPQFVISFCDNDLLTAERNYHGWMATIAPALINQDIRINDKRTYLKGEENDEK